MIALAEALGLPFETRQLEYNRLHLLGPRILGRSLASLTAGSREAILGGAPPDLTISTGHRSVPIVRALRHRSSGRTRAIHLGFPRVSPSHFDLVIATPQYPMPDHPNLLRVRYALTRREAAKDKEVGHIPALPAPRHLLIVGGPTLYWRPDREALLKSVAAAMDEASRNRGSVMVTTSPRTPPALRDEIAQLLDRSEVPTLLAEPGRFPSYASLLASADTIMVTADSVSMISDAVATGRPIALLPITKSTLGRLVFGLSDAIRAGERVYPQDLRFFWKALQAAGIGERLATPCISTEEEMRLIVDRSMALIKPLN